MILKHRQTHEMTKVYIGNGSMGKMNFTMVDKDGYQIGGYLEALYAVTGVSKEWAPLTEPRSCKSKASQMWFRHTDEVELAANGQVPSLSINLGD